MHAVKVAERDGAAAAGHERCKGREGVNNLHGASPLRASGRTKPARSDPKPCRASSCRALGGALHRQLIWYTMRRVGWASNRFEAHWLFGHTDWLPEKAREKPVRCQTARRADADAIARHAGSDASLRTIGWRLLRRSLAGLGNAAAAPASSGRAFPPNANVHGHTLPNLIQTSSVNEHHPPRSVSRLGLPEQEIAWFQP